MKKYRQWLSIEESAQYLTAALPETIAPHDVYRLALDSHLKLSLYFPSIVFSRKVRIVRGPMRDRMMNLENIMLENRGIYLGQGFIPDRLTDFAEPEEDALTFLKGIQETPLMGDERFAAESLFCLHGSLPYPLRAADTLRGILLDMGDSGLYQLQRYVVVEAEIEAIRREAEVYGTPFEAVRPYIERFEALRHIQPWDKDAWRRYVPAIRLPPDAYFVARLEVLDDLIRRALSKETRVAPTARTLNGQAQLLKNLIALHYGPEAARNPRRYFDGKNGQIRQALESLGLSCPSGLTVAKWLEDAE